MADLTFDEAVELAKLCLQELTTAALQGDHTADYARAAPRDRQAWLSWALFAPQDRARWDAVNRIAQWHLRSGVPIPRELAEWVIDRLQRKREKPTKPGRIPEIVRDRVIVSVVQVLVNRGGFHSERNKEKSMKTDPALCCAAGGSACDAVGVAFGIERYGTVERVWLRGKPTPEDASLSEQIGLAVERLFLSYQLSRNA